MERLYKGADDFDSLPGQTATWTPPTFLCRTAAHADASRRQTVTDDMELPGYDKCGTSAVQLACRLALLSYSQAYVARSLHVIYLVSVTFLYFGFNRS